MCSKCSSLTGGVIPAQPWTILGFTSRWPLQKTANNLGQSKDTNGPRMNLCTHGDLSIKKKVGFPICDRLFILTIPWNRTFDEDTTTWLTKLSNLCLLSRMTFQPCHWIVYLWQNFSSMIARNIKSFVAHVRILGFSTWISVTRNWVTQSSRMPMSYSRSVRNCLRWMFRRSQSMIIARRGRIMDTNPLERVRSMKRGTLTVLSSTTWVCYHVSFLGANCLI